ncbi:hypothetical protein E5288_WYG011810 [Bos mutus]|uniref:Peptidase A2 domain-containing protein n=1 Tax=Bos mutus TaxID=72004 RepID=A0A6B0RYF2_9CETA|nr:hypothetical protein [Bos mutus]
MQWVPNQTHTLMEWINAAMHTIWSNAGELLDTDSDQGVLLKSLSRDQRPHIEFAIHLLLGNVQRVMALVDTGAECNLVSGKPEQFHGPSAYTDGYCGQMM